MKLIKIVSLILLTQSHFTNTFAQGPPAYLHPQLRSVPEDPDVSKLGEFGNIDVTLSKGIANVDIPLYTIKGLSIEYPISLTYNPQGIKVNERASNVGLNWTFNGIGVIQRMIHGKPDDIGATGFYNTYMLNETLGAPPIEQNSTNSTYVHTFTQNAYNQIDLEPDEFSYSFLNNSGGFYYNPKPAVIGFKTIPYTKLRIEQLATFPDLQFKITDENGYQFLFLASGMGHINSPTAMAIDFSDFKSQCYLTKILSPEGNVELEFQYTSDIESTIIHRITQGYEVENTSLNPSGTTSHSYSSMTNKFLSKIIAPLQEIDFLYTTRLDDVTQKLQTIIIKNKQGIQTQKRELNYSYFNSTATNSDKVLKLESVDFYNAINFKEYSYTLEYETGSLAKKDSKGIDKWGFSNGELNPSLNERHWDIPLSQLWGDANRQPNLNFAKRGILKKIIYPTGGYSEFEYELNDYGYIDNDPVNINEPIILNGNISLLNQNLSQSTPPNNIVTTIDQTFTMAIDGVFEYTSSRKSLTADPVGTVQGTISGNGVVKNIFTQNMTIANGGVQNFSGNFWLTAGVYTIHLERDDQFYDASCFYSYPGQFQNKKTQTCGGLRIKQIKKFDPYTNNTNFRNFSYISETDPLRSSGVIPNLGHHYGAYQEPHIFCPSCQGCAYLCVIDYWINHYVYASESFNNLNYSDGSPIAYGRVVEGIGLNNEGGSIEHLFTTNNDLGGTGGMYGLSKSSREWRRGLPVKKTYYDNLNSKISESISSFHREPSLNRSTISGQKFSITGEGHTQQSGFVYRFTSSSRQMLSEWQYLNSKSNKLFTNSGTTIQTGENYYYENPDHIQVTRIKSINSDGIEKNKHIKYAMDYNPSPSSDPNINAMDKMVQKNMIAQPIEELTTIKKGGVEQIIQGQITIYNNFETIDKIYPWKVYGLDLEQPIPFVSMSSNVAGVFNYSNLYKRKITFDIYNGMGLPRQATDENGISTYIQYNIADLLPLAQFSNSKWNQSYYNGFEEVSGASSDSKYGKKSFSGAFTYSPNTSLLFGDYILQYWEKSNGVWQFVSTTLNYSGSPISIGNVNSLIDEIAIYPINATFEAFSYNENNELISKTNTNGQGLNFEFDSMGRLKLIRNHLGEILSKNEYGYQIND